MTPDSSFSALDLFKAALDREPAERAPFLDTACGDDEVLRAEVESLLAADAQAAGFLESPLRTAAMSETSAQAADPFIGKQIGRYRVASIIASGGMGTVYEATQEQPKRQVALKVVRAGLASRAALRRFVHEAEILARLRHVGIAQVFEAGTDAAVGGLPYFAMEYIPRAKRITQYAEDRRLPTRQRLELFAKVCDAVHHGHQRGIIHRDLKPGNILVDEAGQPKVIDFGVARATDADMTIATLQTDVGQLVGTLRYMSPEQCEGDSVEIDTRCDVYALGVVLFEVLTTQLPYDLSSSSPFEAPRVIREEEPRRLSAINRTLRGDVETMVLKALEKDRERRYQSAAELAQDIRRYLNNEPIEAKRDRRWYVLTKTLSRHRVAVGVIAFIALLTITSAIALGLMYRTADTQRALAKQAQRDAEDNAEALRVGAYFSTITLAQDAYESGNSANLIDLLDKCPTDLRGWEWHYLKRLSDTSLMTLRGHTSGVGIAVSPGGALIASGGWDSTIKLWDAASGQQLRILTSAYSAEQLAFSPDGKWLLTGDRREAPVRVWDVATGEIRHALGVHHRGVTGLGFSSDGRIIASSYADGLIRLWDAGTGEQLRELRGHEGSQTHVAWSPDGRRLLSGSYDATLKLWDADTGMELLTLTGHTHKVKRVAYSPDGRHIASTSWDNTLRLWNADTGELLKTFDRDTETVDCVAFSPDGQRVVASTGDAVRVWDITTDHQEAVRLGHVGAVQRTEFSPECDTIITCSQDTTIKIWDAAPYEEPPTLRGHEHEVRGVAVSPNGHVIASASWDDTVGLWDAQTRAELTVLRGHTGDVETVAFSPDGRRLASAGHDKTIRIWDIAIGEPLTVLDGHEGGIRRVAWSPDDRHIASASWDGTAKLWDGETGELILSIDAHAKGVSGVAFSPDGTRLITSGYEAPVRIWNIETGEQIRELDTGATQVDDAIFSPDGRLIAAACGDRDVRIWHADTDELIYTLKGHLGLVQCVAFSPAGRRLVSTGYSHLVIIWDVETGTPALTLRGHDQGIPGLAFSPDGRWFVTASNDRTLKIWDAGSAD